MEREQAMRPADGAARAQARKLLRTARFGALATTGPAAWPMASRVALATTIDGAPVCLVSTLSRHTAAMDADSRVSLLVGEPARGDPLAHPRLTLFARAERLARDADAAARRRYLARHPKAALYADFADFAFFRLAPQGADHNGGFGQAHELDAEDLAPGADWRALAEGEAEAVAHMNADHADAVAHYAQLAGADAEGPWTLTALDPDGVDLVCGDDVRRLEFTTPVATPGALRAALVALARRRR